MILILWINEMMNEYRDTANSTDFVKSRQNEKWWSEIYRIIRSLSYSIAWRQIKGLRTRWLLLLFYSFSFPTAGMFLIWMILIRRNGLQYFSNFNDSNNLKIYNYMKKSESYRNNLYKLQCMHQRNNHRLPDFVLFILYQKT